MHPHSVNLPVDRSQINPTPVTKLPELASAVARWLCGVGRRHIPNRLRDPRRGISWGTNHGNVYILDTVSLGLIQGVEAALCLMDIRSPWPAFMVSMHIAVIFRQLLQGQR